jgi:hypothetical protein
MQRIIPLAIAGVMSMIAMAPAASQQLQQPTSLAAPPTQANGTGPQLNNPQTAPPAVPSNPNQRPPSSSPIPTAGPAKLLPTESPRPQSNPISPNQTEKTLDSAEFVGGLIEIAPGHFYDPATGRYYRRTPAATPGH